MTEFSYPDDISYPELARLREAAMMEALMEKGMTPIERFMFERQGPPGADSSFRCSNACPTWGMSIAWGCYCDKWDPVIPPSGKQEAFAGQYAKWLVRDLRENGYRDFDWALEAEDWRTVGIRLGTAEIYSKPGQERKAIQHLRSALKATKGVPDEQTIELLRDAATRFAHLLG